MLYSKVHDTVTFHVFQLTALVIRAPTTHGERFIINLDRVAIKEVEVRGVPLLCVQDHVRIPRFTLTSFFSESRWTILSESLEWRLPIASGLVAAMIHGVF